MKTKIIDRVFAGLLIAILLITGVIYVPRETVVSRASSAYDYVADMAEETYNAVCDAIRQMNSHVSDYYVGFNAIRTLAQKQFTDLTDAEKVLLNDFLNFAYDRNVENGNVLSTALRRMGYFVKSIPDFLVVVKNIPDHYIKLLDFLIDSGLGFGDLGDQPAYTIPSGYTNEVHEIAKLHQQASNDALFYSVSSWTWERLNAYIHSYFPSYYQDNDKYTKLLTMVRLQYDHTIEAGWPYCIFTLFESDNYPRVICFGSSGDVIFSYYFGSFARCSATDFIRYYNLQCSVSSDPFYSTSSQPHFDYPVTGDTPFVDNRSFYFGFITLDGRNIKVWKNIEAYNKSHDWSQTDPDYVSSTTFEEYDETADNSFVVNGTYLQDSNIAQDFRNIVNNVTTNNDYSDNSVTTITNNYYINEIQPNITSPSSSGGGDGEGGGDGDGNGDGNGGGSGSGGSGASGEHVDDFLHEIDDMGNFFQVWLSKLRKFRSFPGQVAAFLHDTMEWIPAEDVALIEMGLASVILIGIWKMIRG